MSQPLASPTGSTSAQVSTGGTAGIAGGAGSGGTGTGSTVTVPNPPPALSAAHAGQLIRAVAAGQTADGHVQLESRYGSLLVKLSFTPARGETLQFRLVKTGTPVLLTLVNDARKPAGTSAQAGRIGPDAPVPRAGDIVTVRAATTGATGPLASGAAPTGAAAPATPSGSAPGFEARLVWLSPAGQTQAPGKAGLITGRVASSPPGGPTLIEGPAGRFVLPAIGNLRPGLEIALRPLGHHGGIPTGVGNGAQGMTAALTSMGSAWTALQDAHAALSAAAATGTTTPLAPTAIPTTGPQLATGMVFFLNALFHGSVQEWLGRDAVRILGESERQGLLNRLGDDFAQLSRVAAEPTTGDWRMAILPLLHENTLHQVRLFYRDLYEEDGDDQADPGTRFVVEASLSKLGALQLDGLVRPARFDLMVRTHSALPEAMRTDIASLFENANREFGAAGHIGFRVENPFGVKPGADGADASGVYA